MRKQFPVQVKPAAKRSQRQSRRGLVILFVLASIAIAVIYVHDWPRQTVLNAAPNPITLDGTGVSSEVAKVLRRGNYAPSVSVPAITPQTADQFAGVPKDPVQQYGQQLPRPNAKP